MHMPIPPARSTPLRVWVLGWVRVVVVEVWGVGPSTFRALGLPWLLQPPGQLGLLRSTYVLRA